MTDTSNLILGCDVSVIQGNIDWVSLFAANYRFAIIRCGVGNGGKDKNYDVNVAGAKAAGLKVMAYNFLYPLPVIPSQPTRDPKVQAKMHADWTNGELCSIDLEWPVPQQFSHWNCNPQQIIDWTTTYLETYETLTGIRPLIYSYPSFLQTVKFPTEFGQKYKLWIASYTTTPVIPAPWTDWIMWQSSGGSHKLPDGVAVDIDYVKDLDLWDFVPAVSISVPPPLPVAAQPVILPPQPTSPPAVIATQVQSPLPVINTAQPSNSIWQTLVGVVSKIFKSA